MGVFDQAGTAVQWRGGHETVRIEPWGTDSVRVRGTVWPQVRDDLPGALLPPRAVDGARTEITADLARVVNGRLTAEIDSRGRVRFVRTLDGAVLLAEVVPHFSGPGQRRYAPTGPASGLHHIEVLFDACDGERFYGLGQHQHGKLDQKGAVIELVQRNTEVSVPFLLSSLGYGFLWNHPGVGWVELGTTLTRWVSEASRQCDYWITAGDTPAEIVRRYADATGRAPMLPDWASGFWQSKLRYRTQDELLQVAQEYKRRGLPLSVIVVDYFHWTRQGEWRFDPHDRPSARLSSGHEAPGKVRRHGQHATIIPPIGSGGHSLTAAPAKPPAGQRVPCRPPWNRSRSRPAHGQHTCRQQRRPVTARTSPAAPVSREPRAAKTQ